MLRVLARELLLSNIFCATSRQLCERPKDIVVVDLSESRGRPEDRERPPNRRSEGEAWTTASVGQRWIEKHIVLVVELTERPGEVLRMNPTNGDLDFSITNGGDKSREGGEDGEHPDKDRSRVKT